ncbi:MAG: membrane dipeptidase [Lachnospiraceae bacterium]|nr:membrane dipeptidase [Lachnospiraceae bacterium]
MKIIDMHCDTISEIWQSRHSGKPQQLAANSLHLDIQKMKKANYMLQNFAMYIDLKKDIAPFEYVCSLIDIFYEEMEQNKNDICVIKTYEEIMENDHSQKMSALLTIEEGGCCEGKIENLDKLYDRGARMMTLTWNYPNELANPNFLKEETDANGFPLFDGSKGLTNTGYAFAERMEELGMIIDVSHLSDAGFWQIADCTKKPFVASHSNARALCGHARNLTDDMIKTIAERGGVIGLNYYGCFLNKRNDSTSTAARIAEHARYITNVGGIECLGLGSDFDGIIGNLEIADCAQMYKLFDTLEAAGFSQNTIEKIAYQNVLRVYKEML